MSRATKILRVTRIFFGLRSATQFDSRLSSTGPDSFIGITPDNIAVDPALKSASGEDLVYYNEPLIRTRRNSASSALLIDKQSTLV